jgi:hypothetical protein
MKEIKKLLYHSYQQNGLFEVLFEIDEDKIVQIGSPVFISSDKIGQHFNTNHNAGSEESSKEKGCSSCKKTGLARLVAGGLGILKSELGIDASSDELFETRKQICLNCPSQQYDFGQCKACTCILPIKLTIKGEECPHGHWKAE